MAWLVAVTAVTATRDYIRGYKMVCVICDHRPAVTNGLCHNCGQKVTALERDHQKHEKPFRYVSYRGIMVAFYRNGGDKLIPRLINRNPDKLPKSLLIDLDHYCDGFTRDQVKRMKAVCLQLGNVK